MKPYEEHDFTVSYWKERMIKKEEGLFLFNFYSEDTRTRTLNSVYLKEMMPSVPIALWTVTKISFSPAFSKAVFS